MSELLCLVGVWLCTFLMHSTLLLGVVALLDRFHCVKSNNALEILWRVAIVGGLVTTTFQCLGKHSHWLAAPGFTLGQWMVGDRQAINEPVFEAKVPNEINNSTVVVLLPSKIEFGAPKKTPRGTDLTYAYAERFALCFTSVFTLIWFVGAMMNSTYLVWRGIQARSELKSRMFVDMSLLSDFRPFPESSKKLPSQTIAVSDRIEGPVALPNGEIVFPRWIFESLTAKHQQAIYAHELAHQVRRDPIWLIFLHLLNAVLWIQPFHWLARRRLAHLAELQADAWAARKLSNARILAESLYSCAERMIAPPEISFGCSFTSKGALIERIDCLLDGTAMSKPKCPYITQLVAASALAFAMFLMPGCNVDTEMAYHSGQKITVTKQGDGKMGEATIRKANLLVKLTHTGTLKLTADNDDVEALENGGQFKLAESKGNVKRLYTVTTDKLGAVKRSYSLNGKETSIDENVQTWFADALQRTVQESGF